MSFPKMPMLILRAHEYATLDIKGEIKVANGIMVANQLTLKLGEYLGESR